MWIKNWWNSDGFRAPMIRFFIPLFILIILGCFIANSCDSSKEDMLKDKKVFDSFIGLQVNEIFRTFGTNCNTVKYSGTEDYAIVTYKRETTITIVKATSEITIFNYYKNISFFIDENGRCSDWRIEQ